MKIDDTAIQLMERFSTATKLSHETIKPRRYLWTDAFAVCNFCHLYRQTNQSEYLQQAETLVEQVHQVLGRYSDPKNANNWLSGLQEQQAKEHPTIAGLRIGKPLAERELNRPFDEALEWQRDGQYYHYLTKWMHALYCIYKTTDTENYRRWSLELAQTAHKAFTYIGPFEQNKRMYWKMSVDLSRPLVSSMGQHDPLDGLLCYLQLQAADQASDGIEEPVLSAEIEDMRVICSHQTWATRDTLGIGTLLADSFKLIQLIINSQVKFTSLLIELLENTIVSIQFIARHNSFRENAQQRIAFRELGLVIGLQAISRMRNFVAQNKKSFSNAEVIESLIGELEPYQNWYKSLLDFWLDPANRATDCWHDHEDINNVMLATSLLPDGFLRL